MKLSCPSCGAPITLMSELSLLTTCPHCRSTLLREHQNLELLGKVSELMDDLSPFQVGTSGYYGSGKFYLAGRLKIKYDGGFWSEWFCIFDDGRQGWLAEAQGLLSMMFENEEKTNWKADSVYNPGDTFQIAGAKWKITDKRHIVYSGYEGELPFRFVQGYQAVSIDMQSEKPKIGTLLYDERGATFFAGEYCDFDSFNFEYLRELDGWTRE